MKSLKKVCAAFVVLCSVLFATGCDNNAGMKPGSFMVVTDKQGNEYIVEHEVLEVYRVKRLPE